MEAFTAQQALREKGRMKIRKEQHDPQIMKRIGKGHIKKNVISCGKHPELMWISK
jgi:hypothetical protein